MKGAQLNASLPRVWMETTSCGFTPPPKVSVAPKPLRSSWLQGFSSPYLRELRAVPAALLLLGSAKLWLDGGG